MSAEGMGFREMPPPQKHESMLQIRRDMVYIGQHLDDPAFVFAASGTEQIGDVEAKIVDVSNGDMATRWFVDPASGHVLRESYETVGRSGPAHGETDLSDWKTTNGITLPATHKNKQNGQDTSVVEFSNIEFNPTIDPKLFEKPTDAKPAQ
jgi:hypothetical protein